MSTRPNSNNGCAKVVAFLVIIAMIAIFIVGFFGHSARRVQPVAPPAAAANRPAPAPPQAPGPARNPIEQQIQPPAGVPRVEGLGIAVLVDVSGSMANSVKDAGNAYTPKIRVAQRGVLEVLRKTDDFAKAHPEKKVLSGVYEFSSRDRQPSCRSVIPLQPPDLAAAEAAVARMTPNGGTPIGDAILKAKRDLDATGITRMHILVVTDGENNAGYAPGDVVNALSRLDETWRPSVYFIAFDVGAKAFNPVREAGGLVLAAANAQELQQTLDYVFTGKILAEQPSEPGK